MPKKSRQRKSPGQRTPEAQAGKKVLNVSPVHKPWQIAVVCIVLAVITFVAYEGVRGSDFLNYDDVYYVLQNSEVQHGLNLHSMAWAFTAFHSSNWHPLTWISHMVDWSLYGNHPAGHHMSNLFLHVANAILLFLLLFYMTGYLGRSALIAFLFALHPAHVESVAWIAERKDLLCGFFWMATLLAYAWYVRRPTWKRFVWVVIGFTCALMSKPMAVTLPFVLLLLDYWPLRRISFARETLAQWASAEWKLCFEKLLLFIMTATSIVLTILSQRAGGALAEIQALPLWERLCNAAISYWRYVWIMVWPDHLRAYYFHETISISVVAAVLSVIALMLVTVVCWRYREEKPYCLIGWLWFLGTLIPVVGIVQVGPQALAERYTYLPYIGLFISVVWLIGDSVASYPKIKVAAQVLAVAVLATYAVKTDAQVKVWKNTVTLFSNVVEIDPRGEFPNLSLGEAYEREGRLTDAEKYLDRALIYNPNRPLTLTYSAYCLMETHDRRDLPLAGQRLEQALRIAPDDIFALANMAQWSALMGRPKDEETYSRRVLDGHPNLTRSRLNLADALQAQGKLEEAIQENRRVLAIDANIYEAHNNLGAIFAKQGLTQDALKEFRISLTINPNQAMAHSQIGRILLETHQLPEAVDEFTQAVRAEPTNIYAHNILGMTLVQEGDYENAVEQFGDVARLDPTNAGARKNLELAQALVKLEMVKRARK
jgi:protein O-mannosyl-transferase